MTEMFSYDFLQRAFWLGSLVALAAAVTGVPLVLRRLSMAGDGLSHLSFGAAAVASVLGLQPLSVAVPAVLAASVVLALLSGRTRISGDAALAVLSTASLAGGVTAVSLSSGAGADLESFLFGSVIGLTHEDAVRSTVLLTAALLGAVWAYPRTLALSFDEPFVQASGLRTVFWKVVQALSAGLTVAVGMRILGALLLSGLLVFPALGALRLARSLLAAVLWACVLALASVWTGLTVSWHADAPAGASIVLSALGFFALAAAAGRAIRGRRKPDRAQ